VLVYLVVSDSPVDKFIVQEFVMASCYGVFNLVKCRYDKLDQFWWKSKLRIFTHNKILKLVTFLHFFCKTNGRLVFLRILRSNFDIGMKRFYLIFSFIACFFAVMADPPGPPGPGGNPGGTGGVPVGSPIDSVTIVLLSLAVVYGIYKLLEFRRNRTMHDASEH
jgi:hypothetical protein